MFKINNRRRSGAFIVNFEHISHHVLVILQLIFNIIAGWVNFYVWHKSYLYL